MSDSTTIHLISGKPFDLMDPMSAEVELHDVAHALARLNRYTGHCELTWSVGQHTLLCYQLVRGWFKDFNHGLAALHHDDPEIITGDWSTPMKNWIRKLGIDYSRKIENPIETALCAKLGLVLDDLHAGVVKDADALAYELEVLVLKPAGHASYQELEDDIMVYGLTYLEFLLGLSTRDVEALWMTVDARERT